MTTYILIKIENASDSICYAALSDFNSHSKR